MYAIINYVDNLIYNTIRKISVENFCYVYDIKSYSPSKLVAIVGNVRLIAIKSDRKVTLYILCGKNREIFQLNVDYENNKLTYYQRSKKSIEELDINSIYSLISSLENDLYNAMIKVSEECELQVLCQGYKRGIKENLIPGLVINVNDKIMESLEYILTILYKRNISVKCSNKNEICIKKVILSQRNRIYIQLHDQNKRNYWYIELNELINKLPDYASDILMIINSIVKKLSG